MDMKCCGYDRRTAHCSTCGKKLIDKAGARLLSKVCSYLEQMEKQLGYAHAPYAKEPNKEEIGKIESKIAQLKEEKEWINNRCD